MKTGVYYASNSPNKGERKKKRFISSCFSQSSLLGVTRTAKMGLLIKTVGVVTCVSILFGCLILVRQPARPKFPNYPVNDLARMARAVGSFLLSILAVLLSIHREMCLVECSACRKDCIRSRKDTLCTNDRIMHVCSRRRKCDSATHRKQFTTSWRKRARRWVCAVERLGRRGRPSVQYRQRTT